MSGRREASPGAGRRLLMLEEPKSLGALLVRHVALGVVLLLVGVGGLALQVGQGVRMRETARAEGVLERGPGRCPEAERWCAWLFVDEGMSARLAPGTSVRLWLPPRGPRLQGRVAELAPEGQGGTEAAVYRVRVVPEATGESGGEGLSEGGAPRPVSAEFVVREVLARDYLGERLLETLHLRGR